MIHTHTEKNSKKRGVVLLFVILFLSALLSIASGMFAVTLGQILITGRAEDSFVALYSTDHGLERALYRDFVQTGSLSCAPTCTEDSGVLPSGGCYTMETTRDIPLAGWTTIRIIGQYQCPGTIGRVVKRAFEYIYPTPVIAFDYNLSHLPLAGISIPRGSSGTINIFRNLISGTAEPVNLPISDIVISPLEPTITFTSITNPNTNPANPCNSGDPCQSTLSISTALTTPEGSYLITVKGDPLDRTDTFTLNVGAPSVPAPNVAHWKFNEASGAQNVVDLSGAGNNGTLCTSTALEGCDPTRTGLGTLPLSFTPGQDDRVIIPDNPNNSLDPSAAFTISAWIKAKSVTSQHAIVAKDSGGYDFKLRLVSGIPKLELEKRGSGVIQQIPYPTDGRWHYVAVTFNNATNVTKLCVDTAGVFSCTPETGVVNTFPGNSLNLGIGARANGTTLFDGCIDEVKMWSIELDSSTQLPADYTLITPTESSCP